MKEYILKPIMTPATVALTTSPDKSAVVKIIPPRQPLPTATIDPAKPMLKLGSGDFHEKAVMSKNISTLFFVWKAHRWQGGSGSRFHTNSLARAVHDWIRCPCWRSVTILLSGSPCGGSLAGPSSLQD
jgi:hypothetical protein